MSEAMGPGAGRKVLVVFHEEILGGATLSVVRLVPILEGRGWRFVFWAARPSSLFDELGDRGLDVRGTRRPIAYSLQAMRLPPGLPRRLAQTPGYLRGFRRLIKQQAPALVHANSLYTLAEALVARSAGVPSVFHIHEMLPAGWKGEAARRIAHALPGEVVAVSEASADQLGLDGWRPRVVNECAPAPASPPARSPRAGRTVVGTVGVVSTRKGTDLFVEAARLVGEREPGVEFRIVGAPTDALEVEWASDVLDRARSLGIAHEPRADVPARLAEWDVFALPSRRDPFPISVLEAMGSGLPVIGTAVDGIREQITPEVGILTAPEDPRALADAIIDLHRHPERRLQLGKAARRRALTHFSLERQAAGLDGAYRAAVDA